MKNTTIILATATALGLLISTGTTAQADTAELFKKKCAICHGEDGKAETKIGQKKGIRSFLDPEVKAAMDRGRMIESLTNGIKEEGSDKLKKKGFADKLSPDEIEALVDYVISLAGYTHRAGTAMKRTRAIRRGLCRCEPCSDTDRVLGRSFEPHADTRNTVFAKSSRHYSWNLVARVASTREIVPSAASMPAGAVTLRRGPRASVAGRRARAEITGDEAHSRGFLNNAGQVGPHGK